jgi:hypothetical protein
MQFVLTYTGPLPAAQGRAANVALKHRIRECFAAQLRDLLGLPPLVNAGFWDGSRGMDLRRQVGHAWFAPIVTTTLHTVAELEVLVLRSGPSGKVMHVGDLDNRVKTLLDALRMPQQANEMPTGLEIHQDHALPVLLEDDHLVTRFSVEAERLLGGHGSIDSQVTIRVRTRVTQPTYAMQLLG